MKPNLRAKLILLVTLWTAGACLWGIAAPKALAAAELVLAAHGTPEFSILISATPSPAEILAADELQHYLNELSGARFEVSSKRTGHFILVCQRGSIPAGIELPRGVSQLPAEGYCLATRKGKILVIGADARGTLYGVYDLLERLGCRWLAPAFTFYHGAHEAVPKQPQLSLSLAETVLEQPVLKYRKLYVEEGHSHNSKNLLQMIAWMPKCRFNTLVVPLNYGGGGRVKWDNWRQELTPELHRRGIRIEVGGHGYENYLNAEMEGGQLFQPHPDWFRLDEQGRRVKNLHAVFCTSNADARAFFISNVIRYLEAHPEIELFDFWPPDSTKWCQCTNCLALGTPSDRQALLLADVSAAVRKVRPGLAFECIAYAACVAPPAKAALDREVLIDFCPIGQCFEAQINDPSSERNSGYVAQLRDWVSSFKGDISIYSYYRKYAWQSLPNLIPHYMQNDLKFYRDQGVHGISTYAEPGDWATYELNHYILGRLAWNPDAKVDELIREFAQARFGAAAALGCKTYAALEENVRHLCSLPGTTLKTPAAYQLGDQNLRALLQELDQAQSTVAAKAEAAALNRLHLTVEYAERDLLLRQAQAENGDVQKRIALLEELGRFLQQHAQDGVFLADRIPAAKQAARYGLPRNP